MDGLLLDSERLARDTFVRACAEVGWDPDLAVYDLCVGSTSEGTEQILKAHFGPRFPFAAVSERWGTLYEARVLREPIEVKRGALELLQRLDALGIPRALATSTRRGVATVKLRNAALFEHFALLVCGGETLRGKPYPDPYLQAAARLQVQPDQCWALEDSDNGVRAAHAAGLRVFQVPDLVPPSEAVRALGHVVVDSLLDVVGLLE